MIFKREPREDLQIDTLISARTRIQGDVQFAGGLHVDGTVTGSVRAEAGTPSRLVQSQGSVVEGSVEAQVVELHGTVRGDIIAPRRATLGLRPASRATSSTATLKWPLAPASTVRWSN